MAKADGPWSVFPERFFNAGLDTETWRPVAATLRSDEGPSARDIDNEVASAVKAIDEAEIDVLNAEDVLGGGWGEAGDMVYILVMAPLYKLIGSRTGRLVTALKETCDTVFSRHVGPALGHAAFRGDQFIMRFTNTNEAQGFGQAATIINDIGSRIFGDPFQSMEIPGLLVVTDVADITNQDGSLNAEMAADVVQGGGLAAVMDEPGPDAPGWLSWRWKSVLGGGAQGAGDPTCSGGPDIGSKAVPEWHEQDHQNRGATQWNDRGSERRTNTNRAYRGGERRKSWRGRRNVDNTRQIGW